MVSQVEGCSPAEESGLRDGDLLIRINGSDARQRPLPWVGDAAPGTVQELEVRRDGEPLEIAVVAIAARDKPETCERSPAPPP